MAAGASRSVWGAAKMRVEAEPDIRVSATADGELLREDFKPVTITKPAGGGDRPRRHRRGSDHLRLLHDHDQTSGSGGSFTPTSIPMSSMMR
jgi:hypothetical protein